MSTINVPRERTMQACHVRLYVDLQIATNSYCPEPRRIVLDKIFRLMDFTPRDLNLRADDFCKKAIHNGIKFVDEKNPGYVRWIPAKDIVAVYQSTLKEMDENFIENEIDIDAIEPDV